MAKRMLKSVIIGLKRDGKDWSPPAGQVHDFTQAEIELIEKANPNALQLPPDESKDKTMRSTPVADLPATKLTGDKPEQQVKPPEGGMEVEKLPQVGGLTADGKTRASAKPHTDNDL